MEMKEQSGTSTGFPTSGWVSKVLPGSCGAPSRGGWHTQGPWGRRGSGMVEEPKDRQRGRGSERKEQERGPEGRPETRLWQLPQPRQEFAEGHAQATVPTSPASVALKPVLAASVFRRPHLGSTSSALYSTSLLSLASQTQSDLCQLPH